MIRELSRAIELSGREGCGDLEARGIWGGLGWGESHWPFQFDGLSSSLVPLSHFPPYTVPKESQRHLLQLQRMQKKVSKNFTKVTSSLKTPSALMLNR